MRNHHAYPTEISINLTRREMTNSVPLANWSTNQRGVPEQAYGFDVCAAPTALMRPTVRITILLL